MPKVVLKEVEYKNFGKCVEISNGIVKLLVTIDIGPRIINYSFADGENILWEDIRREISKPEVANTFGSTWYLYGGHRFWTSPEALPRTYYADNSPVEYEKIENGARFIQEVQKWNQYQYEISVILTPDSSCVKIIHKLTNLGAWDISLALWGVTALSRGGLELVPQPTKDTGLLGNRLLALWPYTNLTDRRVTWGDRYITLRQDPSFECAFKFGLNSEHGFVMYFNHGDVFVKKYDIAPCGTYPDGGMSFETYTNKHFLELESLGEYKIIPAGKSTEHCEYWSLSKGDAPEEFNEIEFDKLVKKYV